MKRHKVEQVWRNTLAGAMDPKAIELMPLDPMHQSCHGVADARECLETLMHKANSAGRTLLGDDALDYFLQNQDKIPSDWKRKLIAFARDGHSAYDLSGPYLYVRALVTNPLPRDMEWARTQKWSTRLSVYMVYPLVRILWGKSEFNGSKLELVSGYFRGGLRDTYVAVIPNEKLLKGGEVI